MNELTTIFNDIAFWSNFLSNCIATIIGVLLALLFDRFFAISTYRQQKKQSIILHHQRELDMLTLILNTLEKNKEIYKVIKEEISPEKYLFTNFDLELLESTSSIKYEIIDDLLINEKVDNIRYELSLAHQKINVFQGLFSEYTGTKPSTKSRNKNRRIEVTNSISNQLQNIEIEIEELQIMIKNKLN